MAVSLPARSVVDEDDFLAAMRAEPAERVREATIAALDAGRVQLAARLVGLLPDEVDDDPDLDKARRAARLLLTRRDPALAEELSLLVQRLQDRRRARFRRRHRRRDEKSRKPSKWKRR